jgi:molybdate transport system substrate-binding protein
MSLAVAPGMAHAGHFYEIPADEYPPLEQGAALTKAGAAKPLARAYLAFLQSEEARKILEQFGFRLPK